jgi:hypothetical protein
MAMSHRADTGRAIQAAAHLDHLLLLLLTKLSLPHLTLQRQRTLDTFAKRIRLAHVGGLIDDATNDDLKTINDVRVVFARAELPMRFSSAPVRIKARRFLGWKPGASARRLFDKAVDRAAVAIRARTNSLMYEPLDVGEPILKSGWSRSTKGWHV